MKEKERRGRQNGKSGKFITVEEYEKFVPDKYSHHKKPRPY